MCSWLISWIRFISSKIYYAQQASNNHYTEGIVSAFRMNVSFEAIRLKDLIEQEFIIAQY